MLFRKAKSLARSQGTKDHKLGFQACSGGTSTSLVTSLTLPSSSILRAELGHHQACETPGFTRKLREVPGAKRMRATENSPWRVTTTLLPAGAAQTQRPGDQLPFPLPAPRPQHHARHRLEQREEVHVGPHAPAAEGTGSQAALGDVGS